jgi:hypothetical protein
VKGQDFEFEKLPGAFPTKITHSIPCRVGEWGRMSFWIKNNFGASTDTFRIEAGYLAADGSEVPYYSNVIDLSQATTH